MKNHEAITALVRYRIEDLTDETGHRRTGPMAAAADDEIAQLEESLRLLEAAEKIEPLVDAALKSCITAREELEK